MVNRFLQLFLFLDSGIKVALLEINLVVNELSHAK